MVCGRRGSIGWQAGGRKIAQDDMYRQQRTMAPGLRLLAFFIIVKS